MKNKLLFLAWISTFTICVYGVFFVIPNAKRELRRVEYELHKVERECKREYLQARRENHRIMWDAVICDSK